MGPRLYTSAELTALGVAHEWPVRVDETVRFYGPGPFALGRGCRIDAYCVLTGTVRLGRCHVATGCYLQGAVGGVTMADFAGLAGGVHVYTASDDYTGGRLPVGLTGGAPDRAGAVTLGRGAIVGAGSVVLPAVDIGEGAAVGMLSGVKRSVPAFEVWAGTPARRVGIRPADQVLAALAALGAAHE